MNLSRRAYQNAVTAAGHLLAGEKPIRILRSLNWPAETGHAFLASGGQTLPVIEYPPFDGTETRAQLAAARALLVGDHPVFAWLRRTADKLELAAAMLENIGSAAFYQYSQRLYGTPERVLLDGVTKTINLARHLDDALANLDFGQLVVGGTEEEMNAEEFAGQLAGRLPKYFQDQAPAIEIDENMSSKAAAGSRRIRISKTATFSAMDVHQLMMHEALVHTATALNGRAQTEFPILGAGHAGTTEIQEGLAVFAELISGALDPIRFRRLVDRVIAIQMSVDGADFIEVYKYFLGQHEKPAQAFDDTRRVFRGGVITGGAPFTKDGVYLNGLLRVHNFMRTVIKLRRADLIRLLFVGKLDLEDVPALAALATNGHLTPANILPPWARDMRFLVSYLAYSSFLNQVKLPGLQSYYTTMLDEVPDVWDFTDSGNA